MYSKELKAAEQQCNRMIACAELRKTYERPEDIPDGDAELDTFSTVVRQAPRNITVAISESAKQLRREAILILELL